MNLFLKLKSLFPRHNFLKLKIFLYIVLAVCILFTEVSALEGTSFVQFLVTPVSGLFLSNCHSIVGSFRHSPAYWCSSRVRNKILLLWQETGQHVV